MNQTEHWKVIYGANVDTDYIVSNLGRVMLESKNQIIRPKTNRGSHSYVRLFYNDQPNTYDVHTLVANTFLPNVDNKPYVHHIDGNKMNNNVRNLRFCSFEDLFAIQESVQIGPNCNFNMLKPFAMHKTGNTVLWELLFDLTKEQMTHLDEHNICCICERMCDWDPYAEQKSPFNIACEDENSQKCLIRTCMACKEAMHTEPTYVRLKDVVLNMKFTFYASVQIID